MSGILALVGVAQVAQVAARLPHVPFLASLVPSTDCEDGVCTMPTSPQESGSESTVVNDLVSMGFSKERAVRAIQACDDDLEMAAALLETEDEHVDVLMHEGGWCEESSRSAVRETGPDLEAAKLLLKTEEESIASQFNMAVAEMVENGWEEVVSRQALLAQWNIDQRKAQGVDVTVDANDLATIKPTLKTPPRKKKAAPPTATTSATAAKAAGKQQPKGKDPAKPKPAKKEDCVFDVTGNNFQKVVLESPVPVLLDVYADWCGPCKQLGPLLEKAAMESGGMFRLAKVNSDAQQRIAQNLKVQGLPTVYTVKDGKLTDRFVGMPPQTALQEYLVRSITGFGKSAQTEMTEADFGKMTMELAQMAGFASLTVKKKERLLALVTEAFWADGTLLDGDTIKLSDAAKVALTYIRNVANDVRNPKFRSIKTSSTGFSKMADSTGAIKLIETAGFRLERGGEGGDVYTLIHNNVAILRLISQKVSELMQANKYSSAASLRAEHVNAEVGNEDYVSKGKEEARRTRSSSSSSSSLPKSKSKKEKKSSSKDTKKRYKATDIRGGATPMPKPMCRLTVREVAGKQLRKEFKDVTSTTLRSAIVELLDLSEDTDVGALGLEIRSPLPRREITAESADLNITLSDISRRGDITLGFKEGQKRPVGTSNRRRGGQNTLFSTGLNKPRDRTQVEYFGGDSTVFLSAPPDDCTSEEKEGHTADDVAAHLP